MGGIVVAVGENAADAVRRGSAAVRRRPWQAPRIWSTEGAALALCAERGGIATGPEGTAAVVEGEIVVGDETLSGPEAAVHLLRLFREGGEGFRAPSGQFAAALWAEASGALVLLTDRLGTRPLFVCRAQSTTIAATEQKALLAAGATHRLDLDGVAQLLAYEFVLGETTLLEDVRILPPASTTVIDADGERTFDRGRYRVDPGAGGSLDEAVDEFARLLETAVLRRLDDRTALALSGGMDSRCLATIVGRHRPGTAGFVFGAARSEELERGSAVAALAGLEYRPIELDHGYVARDVAETVWLTEGQIRCFHSHPIALRQAREHGVASLLVGYGGDVVVRTTPFVSIAGRSRGSDLVESAHRRLAVALDDDALPHVLTRRFADELGGRARDAVSRALARLDGPDVLRLLDFTIHESYRRKVLPSVELYADDLVHRDPYLDDDLLDFLARVPLSRRLAHEVQIEYVRRFPALAKVPNPKTGVAPGLRGARLGAARAVVKARRAARARSDRLLRQLGRPPRSGYSDYASHLAGPAGVEALGVLLEERTLDRGQVDASTVRRLVEETTTGRAVHTQALGVLLTLEHFQRLFLDGDGFAGQHDADGLAAYAGAP